MDLPIVCSFQLGIVGVFIVATLTDHCCQILVRTKVSIIDETCRKKLSSGRITESEVEPLKERLQLAIGYGDIGRHVFGPWCYQLIQAAVCFTQFITCLVYFVFIANTVQMIFPLKLMEFCNHTNHSSLGNETPVNKLIMRPSAIGIPMLNIPNLDRNLAFGHQKTVIPFNSLTGQIGNSTDCKDEEVSTAPDLRIIVLFPLPFFIFTSLIRNVRYLAPLSSIATFALAIGAFSVLGFLIHGMYMVCIWCVHGVYV